MAISLRGRVVAVTGAARGIGFTTAKTLKARGARVAIGDIDEAKLKEAAAELGITTYARLDVTDPEAFRAFLAKVENELGPLDALVNNAGIMPTGPLLAEDDRITRRILEINTLGLIFGTKRALELMVPRRSGHIVNMASTMGETYAPGLATYHASKAAAILFSDAARTEFRKSGVKISTILPGPVNTELLSGIKGVRGIKNVEPEDVAEAIAGILEQPKSKARVYVPRSFGLIVRSQRFVPRRAAEALNRALGSETVILHDTDTERRRTYVERLHNT